jgi:hypothetical protein
VLVKDLRDKLLGYSRRLKNPTDSSVVEKQANFRRRTSEIRPCHERNTV